MQAGPDFNEEEVKEDHDEDGTSTPPAFWRASVNAVEASDLSEPATFRDAVNGPDQVHWRKAINAELESMRLRGVFQAAILPKGQQAIGTKWVFKIKRNSDGTIARYKARLVARGFTQEHGIDYTETFAPTVKFSTIRVILTLAAYHDWEVEQLDVVTTFLSAELKEKVYIREFKLRSNTKTRRRRWRRK